VILEKMEFPEPCDRDRDRAEVEGRSEKASAWPLAKLVAEDPRSASIPTRRAPDHLEGDGRAALSTSRVDILKHYKVEANIGAPQVAYVKRITAPSPRTTPIKKRPGGRPVCARQSCWSRFRQETGFRSFDSKVVGGNVPKEYVPGVEKGIEFGCWASGVLAGFPVVDLKVTLIAAPIIEWTPRRSPSKSASRSAMREGLREGGPVLLEPIMKVEVVTPENLPPGPVIGDLNSRRGQIQGRTLRRHTPMS